MVSGRKKGVEMLEIGQRVLRFFIASKDNGILVMLKEFWNKSYNAKDVHHRKIS